MRSIHSSCRFPSLIYLLDYHNIELVSMAICCNFLFPVRSSSLHFKIGWNPFWLNIFLIPELWGKYYVDNFVISIVLFTCNIISSARRALKIIYVVGCTFLLKNCDTAWYDSMKIKRYLVKIDYSFSKILSIQYFFIYCDKTFFSLFPNLVQMLCQWNHSFINLIHIFEFLYLRLNYATLHYWSELAYQLWQSLLWRQLSVKSVSSVWISHGHLYTGQLSRHFLFWQVTSLRPVTLDPNYTPGVDFLDHDFL